MSSILLPNFGALLDRYDRECIAPYLVPIGAEVHPALSAHSATTYRARISRWIRPRWEFCPVQYFAGPAASSGIEAWLGSLVQSPTNPNAPLKPSSVHSIFTLMKVIFLQAVKWGYLTRDQSPMGDRSLRLIKLPAGSSKRAHKPRSLSPKEFMAMRELFPLGTAARTALELVGWLGDRRSEAFGLQWHDIDFKRGVIHFRRGLVDGRITPLKSEASRSDLNLLSEVREALLAWRKVTPYNQPENWVFASAIRNGALPIWPTSLMRDHIQPVLTEKGFGKVGWHTFRHSVTSWGKEVLKPEETKELVRHANLKTTSDVYGGLSLDAKGRAQKKLRAFVRKGQAVNLAKAQPITETRQ